MNAQLKEAYLIDKPTISAGEKNTIFLFLISTFLYFYGAKRVILKAMQSRAQK